jgi:hypothetical protein
LQSIHSRKIVVYSRIIPALHHEVSREVESNLRFSQADKLNLADGE